MSGFEVVVRPVVLPNIRPQSPRVLAALDDPEQGIATMSGSGGGMIALTTSSTLTINKQYGHREVQRTYDVDTVYEMDDQGKVNRDNKVEIERIVEMKVRNALEEEFNLKYSQPPPADNVETTQSGLTRNAKD